MMNAIRILPFAVALAVSAPFGAANAADEVELWTVTELGGRMLIAERLPTMAFGPDGKVGGTSGCNQYFGQVERTETELTFGDAIGATRMMCEPPYDTLEQDFFETLPKAASYEVNGDMMAIMNAEGVTILRMTRTPE